MLDSYLIKLKQEEDGKITLTVYDKELGKVFYPSSKAIKDGIERSMA